jgi:hypothetical protein
MKTNFGINKYSQAFNRFDPVYGGFAKFLIIDQYIGFPGEGWNSGFTDAEFHVVSNSLTLYSVDIRL